MTLLCLLAFVIGGIISIIASIILWSACALNGQVNEQVDERMRMIALLEGEEVTEE